MNRETFRNWTCLGISATIALVNILYTRITAYQPKTMFSLRRETQISGSYRLGKRQFLDTSGNITGVIVADDDPMIRSVLRAKLEAFGVNVFLASDGLEAVEFAARVQASLIILDLNMPRLNGLLACQRIRQMPGNARTPIVILTSTIAKDTEVAATRVGATGYFMKPFRMSLLLQELSRFLPITDVTRDLIRGEADRVNKIANSVSNPGGDKTSGKSGSDSLLDRDKYILNVLRG